MASKGDSKVGCVAVAVAAVGGLATVAAAFVTRNATITVAELTHPAPSSLAAPMACLNPFTRWRNSSECAIGKAGRCSNLVKPTDEFRLHLAHVNVEGIHDVCKPVVQNVYVCITSSEGSACLSQAEACRNYAPLSGPWSTTTVPLSGRDLSEGLSVEIRDATNAVVSSQVVKYASGIQEIVLCEGGVFTLKFNPSNVKSFDYFLEAL